MNGSTYFILALTVVNVATLATHALGSDVPAATQVVRAERFELVDQRGVVRAKLAVMQDGFDGLSLFNANGEHRGSFAARTDGADLLMESMNGKHRVMLSTGPDSQDTYLELLDSDGAAYFHTEDTMRTQP